MSDSLFEKFGKTIPENTVIFNEDDKGKEMYLIKSGKVKIYKTFLKDDELSGGKKLERELVILGPGDFFGEMSLLNDEPRAATAISLEETDVLAINKETFENMVKTNGNFALKIISKLCERVKNTDHIIEEILIHHKQRKIIAKLIVECDNNTEIELGNLDGLISTENKLTAEDIRNIIEKLSHYHIISFENEKIKIIDIENLKKVKAFLES